METVKVIITGRGLRELDDCDDMVHDLVRFSGVERVEIVFRGSRLEAEEVLQELSSQAEGWHGVAAQVAKVNNESVVSLECSRESRDSRTALPAES
jgi:hypothetical protein